MATSSALDARGRKRRVAVTGIGAVTPLGVTLAETWAGVVAGRSPAAPIRRFDASGMPTQFAYEVDERRLPVEADETATRLTRFGVAAAREAIAQAGLPMAQGMAAERTSVCLGVGISSPPLSWYEDVYLPRRYDSPRVDEHLALMPHVLTRRVARLIGARGEATTVHTACASSGQAVGEAYELIAYGDADTVLTGGADAMIEPLYVAGFSLLGAMSRRNDDPATASRPFDRGRDGFVLGEGACMLVLEELEQARSRGAQILGELCGFGVSASAFRVTDLHPEGRGPREAMRDALASAGIGPELVGYINAHGTSTPLNDRLEAEAIRRVFPPELSRVRVSSTKSMTGHLIAAAGAAELAFVLESLRHQVLPPSINLFHPDGECRVRLTEREATPVGMEFGLSNSVGFGGTNTAIVAARYAG